MGEMPLKLYSTVTAIVVCICFVQICRSEEDQTMKKYKEYYNISDLNSYLNGSNAIKDIGPEFVDDVQLILEKFDHNTYVISKIKDLMEALAILYHGKDAKITPAAVKELNLKMDQNVCRAVNTIDILQSILVKQLPADRFSGVLNLFYVLEDGGTKNDLENAVGYLYGTEPRPSAVNPNIPPISSMKCSGYFTAMTSFVIQVLIYSIKDINSTKLNPKVTDDVLTIAEKFPYNTEVFYLLQITENLLKTLDKQNSTNDICELRNQSHWFKMDLTPQEIKFKIVDLEMVLPTRAPEENYKDMLNLIRASIRIDGSDFKKALEYAYTPAYFDAVWCNENVAINSTLES